MISKSSMYKFKYNNVYFMVGILQINIFYKQYLKNYNKFLSF